MSNLTPDQWFSRCTSVVLQAEGWDTYTDTPGDRGGPTKYGITLATLSAYRGHPCIAADVQALGEPEALDIYRANYWHPVAGDQLPPGVNLMTFDCAVNQGPGHAVRWLQAAAGAPVDGVIGPATVGAILRADSQALLQVFKAERLASYKQNTEWEQFGKGWTARNDHIFDLATQWAGEA